MAQAKEVTIVRLIINGKYIEPPESNQYQVQYN